MEKKSGIKKGKKIRISAFKVRVAIISAGVVLAFFGIFLRLFFLQVVKKKKDRGRTI